jgi:hypothetical protein
LSLLAAARRVFDHLHASHAATILFTVRPLISFNFLSGAEIFAGILWASTCLHRPWSGNQRCTSAAQGGVGDYRMRRGRRREEWMCARQLLSLPAPLRPPKLGYNAYEESRIPSTSAPSVSI